MAIDEEVTQGRVRILSGSTSFLLRALRAGDFPRLPDLPEAGVRTIEAAAFIETSEHVVRCASRDETRPLLTGVLVSAARDELRMVATDSYRLGVKHAKLQQPVEGEFEATLPARALRELGRIARDTRDGDISIGVDANQVVFAVGDVVLSSRVIEGQFPNYHQLLPEKYEHELRLDRSELLAVARRVSLMAQRNAPLKLRFEAGSLTMSAETPDVGEARESLPVNYEGETFEIGFNPQFLQDGLEGVQSEYVLLKLISPLRPGLLEAAGGDGEADAERFLYLIMPVRLNV